MLQKRVLSEVLHELGNNLDSLTTELAAWGEYADRVGS